MKHAVIVGHPDPESFTLSMAKTYAATVESMGHTCVVRDLYRLGFEPCLQISELPTRPGHAPSDDVAAERALIGDADVFAFVYPFWFNTPPAIIKGYIDRVFGLGFGYSELHAGGREPLLTGRQIIHVTASGSSSAWLNEQGAWTAMRTLFEDYVAKVCGMQVRPHIHFDSVVSGLAPRWVETNLKTLETKVQEYFPA